jgi:hypothetical protein
MMQKAQSEEIAYEARTETAPGFLHEGLPHRANPFFQQREDNAYSSQKTCLKGMQITATLFP